MSKRRLKKRRTNPTSAYHHYPPQWQPGDWLVPFSPDNYAYIHHGHQDTDDHSLCGPQLFCCYKAARLIGQHYPDLFPNHTLSPTANAHLLAWLSPAGPAIFYFYFCDPLNPDRVYFQGFALPLLRQVLLYQRPLADLVVNSIVLV